MRQRVSVSPPESGAESLQQSNLKANWCLHIMVLAKSVCWMKSKTADAFSRDISP
jgi:hypothetical protein